MTLIVALFCSGIDACAQSTPADQTNVPSSLAGSAKSGAAPAYDNGTKKNQLMLAGDVIYFF